MKKIKPLSKEKLLKTVYIIVLVSFIIPAAFLLLKIFGFGECQRPKADYLLMFIQCLLGIVVIHLPMILEKKFKFEIPTTLCLMYVVFLYCAIFLGEVRDFFYTVKNWDVILHCFSSIMAGSFGFIVVSLLNRDEHTNIRLSPFFVALFSFCFAVTIGALWEVYEYCADGIFGLNMQKFMLADKTVLSGHAALTDTIKDIIVDCLGALFASATGYLSIKRGKGWISQMISEYSSKTENNDGK